jgi:hypothetical protein
MKLNFNISLDFEKQIYILTFLILVSHIFLSFLEISLANYFDFYLILLFLLNFKLLKNNYLIFIILFSIIVIYILRFLFSDNFFDSTYFFVSLKLLVFCLLFISFNPQKKIDINVFKRAISILYFSAVIIILSDKLIAIFSNGIISGILFRPRLVSEINFDIVLLIELWLILNLMNSKYKKIETISLIFILIISLSRSGFLAFLLTIIIKKFYNSKIWTLKNLTYAIISLFFFILLFITYNYFRTNNFDFSKIDRIQIFNILSPYLYSLDFTKLFFGHGILTPLPQEICITFSDYALQVTGDKFSCNSVILLSFYLRSIYEFGLFITFIIPFIYLKTIVNANNYKSLLFLMPIIIISFAVGGFYNSLSIISLLICKFYINNINYFFINNE